VDRTSYIRVAGQEAAARSEGIPIPHLLENRGVPPNAHKGLLANVRHFYGYGDAGLRIAITLQATVETACPAGSHKLEQRLGSSCLSDSMAGLFVKYVVTATAEERIAAMKSIARSSLLIISPHPSAQPGRVLFWPDRPLNWILGALVPVHRLVGRVSPFAS